MLYLNFDISSSLMLFRLCMTLDLLLSPKLEPLSVLELFAYYYKKSCDQVRPPHLATSSGDMGSSTDVCRLFQQPVKWRFMAARLSAAGLSHQAKEDCDC